jgi:hypothetical protein
LVKKPTKGFERYPAWMVLVANAVFISVYLAGLYLVYLVWPVLALVFLVYVVYLESSVYRDGCVNCYYYGKVCAFGRGKIAKAFLRKGDPKKFTEKTVSFSDFLPSSLVNVVPLVAGIWLLLQRFDWLVAGLMVWPLIVMFLGNPVIYGELACPNCKQARVCCPVCEFFRKRAEKKK